MTLATTALRFRKVATSSAATFKSSINPTTTNTGSTSLSLSSSSSRRNLNSLQKAFTASNNNSGASGSNSSTSLITTSGNAVAVLLAAYVVDQQQQQQQQQEQKNKNNNNDNGDSLLLLPQSYPNNNSSMMTTQCEWKTWGGLSGLWGGGGTRDNNNVRMIRRKSEGKGQSADFQILQALEVKDEFQKIRLARFLREIHELAMEMDGKGGKNNVSKKVGLKRKKTKKGEISLRNVDLTKMTPEMALMYQNEMRSGRHFSRDSIIDLTKAASTIFSKEETLINLRDKKENMSKVTVVGDLHGSIKCLDRVYELVGKMEDPNQYLIFCGDYVDRGDFSLEVFCSLLFLKLAYPDRVYMLRGNHEDVYIASVYGFQDEIRQKYGAVDSDIIWEYMSDVFSSLPIAALSNHAWIVHGGIPSQDFNLTELAEITPEERCKVESVIKPQTEHEKKIGKLMWSDPSRRKGVRSNPRGCGIEFGPDVARKFMDKHDISYIIRSHEPIEQGIDGLSCGGGKYVVTVFSTASYPNGTGSNLGAVVHIDEKTGDMESVQFEYIAETKAKSASSKAHQQFLTDYVCKHRPELEAEFKKVELDGLISVKNWIQIMAQRLEMSDEALKALQPSLAPTTTPGGQYINWLQFLNRYNPNLTSLVGGDQVGLIQEHEDKIINLFKVLDVDDSGTIDRGEFVTGIEMLNKTCLADSDQKFTNPEELFNMFDVDGNGEIDLEEFTSVVAKSKTISKLTNSVDSKKIDVLHRNHEMLVVAFRFLDRDGSGTIDRDEFRTGIELLNKRLPKEEQFGDPDELFTAMDGDGSGEIDITEFNVILQQTVSS